jgi:hypothetical protein
MGAEFSVRVGDRVEMRKPHACGANRWTVLRIGADIRVRCEQCGRTVMLARSEFEKAAKRLMPPAASAGASGAEGAEHAD